MTPKELDTAQNIIQFAHEFHGIVAQSEIQKDETGLRAIIEYPVKTLNTGRRE